MARPMRTPVQWDRGSVSVAPIAQPFKGILEGFDIPESAYSAEGGFGGSGLLDWEPAEFISPEVVWGTQFVSGAPPPSEYGDVGPNDDKKCGSGFHGTWPNCIPDDDKKCGSGFHGTWPNCIPDDDDPRTCLERGLCADCSSPPCDDPDPKCSDIGQCGTWGNCHSCVEPTCADSGQCGPYPTCYPCDPGQDTEPDDDDDSWYDVVGPGMEVWVGATGPEPDYGNVFDDGGYVPPAPVIPDISGLLDDPDIPYVTNPWVDDFTSGWPTIYGTPYEDEITSADYDPWAFEDVRGGRR